MHIASSRNRILHTYNINFREEKSPIGGEFISTISALMGPFVSLRAVENEREHISIAIKIKVCVNY